MSHLTQMAGLAVQNFVSAAVGMAVAVALVRGLVAAPVGHDRQLLGRPDPVGHPRSCCRISFVAALVLVSQGVIQNLDGFTAATTLEGASQVIPGGPVASQEAIKELGTNGGGFLNANSAHPFENPNGFTNLLQMFLILLIPFALTYTFGRLAKDQQAGLGGVRRHVRAVGRVARSIAQGFETGGNPELDAAGRRPRRGRRDRGRRQHGGQGGPLRAGGVGPVRRHHHRHVDRRRQLPPTTASRPAAAPCRW